MADLLLQDIKYEGNSIFISSYPIVGILALGSFVEDLEGEDLSHTFEKSFRYTVNGVHFSEWSPLSTVALLSLSFLPHQVIQFEFQYNKNQPLGEDVLQVNDLTLTFVQNTVFQEMFDKTIFKTFFESTDTRVLNWYVNVLNKLYQKGLIPDYLERNSSENSADDDDFIQFWSSVAKFFSYYVIYARQFQNFNQSEVLLSEFLKQRGLSLSNSTSLFQMNLLMRDYYAEINKRGTISVVDKEKDGALLDGELLRLLDYIEDKDEFIFNPRLPQHIGWNLGNSSPLYKGFYLHQNINKAPEKQTYPNNILLYTGVQDLAIEDGKQTLHIVNNSFQFQSNIKIDPQLNYEFSFLIKTSAVFSVYIDSFDIDGNLVDLYSASDGLPANVFVSSASLYRADKFIPVKFFIYAADRDIANEELNLHMNQGVNLILNPKSVYINIYIESETEAFIYGLKILPLTSPYSHGLIQTNNVIDCFAVNNNHQLTFEEIRANIVRYLIPYSSHLLLTNINDIQ